MTDEFVPLDDNVRREFERFNALGERLAKAWKERDLGVSEDTYVDQWRQKLSADKVLTYISDFRMLLEITLIRSSMPGKPSEAFIYAVNGEPLSVEVLAVEGSEARKEDFYCLIQKDGFLKFEENYLKHALTVDSQDPAGSLALPYLADSLRRGELDFSRLKIEYVTPENDVLRVTLDHEDIF